MKRPKPGMAGVIAAALLSTACAAPNSGSGASSGPPADLHPYFFGTEGRVGHHMHVTMRAACPGPWTFGDARIINGTVPPGIGPKGNAYVGTPTQPGTWVLDVEYKNVICEGRNYGTKRVTATFQIQGFAAPKVN